MYKISPPVDCSKKVDVSCLNGKTAIVTGGASGLGEAYARALSAVGVNVVIADMNVVAGEKLATECGNAKFIKCNVTVWNDQLQLFKQTLETFGSIDYVIANAGICPKDEVFTYAGDEAEPIEPKLLEVDVNLKGTLFTSKLAMHYFIKQNGQSQSPRQRDTCLVLIGSSAAFLDIPRGPVYPSTKWAVRGIMHSLRRTSHYHGTRVNVISPWYVKTSILSEETFEHVTKAGVEFATVEDAGESLMRILSDRSIHGKSLWVTARKYAEKGYMDLDIDDYPKNDLLQGIQFDQTRRGQPEEGLFLDFS